MTPMSRLLGDLADSYTEGRAIIPTADGGRWRMCRAGEARTNSLKLEERAADYSREI